MFCKKKITMNWIPALNTIYSLHRNNSPIQCCLLEPVLLVNALGHDCLQMKTQSISSINWIVLYVTYEWMSAAFVFLLLANALALSKPEAFSSRTIAIAQHVWILSESPMHLWWRVYDYLLCQNDFIILHKLETEPLVSLKTGVTFYH